MYIKPNNSRKKDYKNVRKNFNKRKTNFLKEIGKRIPSRRPLFKKIKRKYILTELKEN